MAALDTVADYLTYARALLQDQVVPYRYSDVELVQSLNTALAEAARLRPDLFMVAFRTALPTYSAASTSASVALDVRYRNTVLLYIVGQAQLRDVEDVQDQRAIALLKLFAAQFTTPQA